jgi:hypothetical protein
LARSQEGKVTRRERFLAEMDAVILSRRLLDLTDPAAEDAIYDSESEQPDAEVPDRRRRVHARMPRDRRRQQHPVGPLDRGAGEARHCAWCAAPPAIRQRRGFVSRAILAWLTEAKIETALIDPGEPWQNGANESFNNEFRDASSGFRTSEGFSLRSEASRASARTTTRIGMRRFARVELGDDTVPDETTILRFRHLLDEAHLQAAIFEAVNGLLTEKRLLLRTGTIVDATILAARRARRRTRPASATRR